MYSNFQQIRGCRSVKTVCTNLFAKNVINCINLQIAIRIIKISRLSDIHYLTTDIQTKFKINWSIKNKIKPTMKYFPYATDGRTEGRTAMSDNNP